MSDNAKRDKRVQTKVNKYIKTTEEFLRKKNNGEINPEWMLSIEMLKQYLIQFFLISEEINNLDSMVTTSRYGSVPHPLLACRNQTYSKLLSIMKELGLTLKSQSTMKLVAPSAEESPLENFVKGKIEKR